MKQVWKCDHCSQTDIESDKILKHEVECSFNKSTKHCYTCKYAHNIIIRTVGFMDTVSKY